MDWSNRSVLIAGGVGPSLGKMGEVVKDGRTVLFVSHQLGLASTLCERTILWRQGRLVGQGPSAAVIDGYVRTSPMAWMRARRSGSRRPRRPGGSSPQRSPRERDGGDAFDVFDPVSPDGDVSPA